MREIETSIKLTRARVEKSSNFKLDESARELTVKRERELRRVQLNLMIAHESWQSNERVEKSSNSMTARESWQSNESKMLRTV